MNARGKFKILLWIGLAIVLIVAAAILIDRVVPRQHLVTFSFSGWTNDFQGARVAVPVSYTHLTLPTILRV